MSPKPLKPNSKKNLQNGLLLFLLCAAMLFFTFYHFNGSKSSNVAFSHQVEHLVNLDLIQNEENRKIAGEHLVTFSGKFKDQQTESARARFQYLELLNRHHELRAEKEELEQELQVARKHAEQAADTFIHLAGLIIPHSGFMVIPPSHEALEEEPGVVIHSISNKSFISLHDLQSDFVQLHAGDSKALPFGRQLLSLIERFRSPSLGIGNARMKEQLKSLEQVVSEALRSGEERSCLMACKEALAQLGTIVADLQKERDTIRLGQLRSVRNYKELLDRSSLLKEEIERNRMELDRARQSVANVAWFYNNQELSARGLEKQDADTFARWFMQAKEEWERYPLNKGSSFKAPDQPRNLVLEKVFKSEEPPHNYFSYFITLLPVLLVLLLLYLVYARQMKGAGSSALNFGKSPAKLLTKERNKVTFTDVAGCDEAKEELQEVVDFLRDTSKFTALGARIPKGVLMIGAPGTGKTLIAKAVAGEADRPFFFISGSDFVEMFVGVGASRIRDLFDQAKKHAPCIVFIDEIDAVGRHRGSGIGGGHDEREQTLNQLLVEMDGFDTNEGVILIAATNRPDVLDKALLRPGRFDRRIIIDLPDVKGRFEILKVHARKIKLDASVDLMHVARNTPGSSGADLANILNEAALIAARKGRSAVTTSDADEACDKVRYGKERRSLEIDKNEKRTTAIHESGHAIVALCVKHADPVDKVTIIPRGLSLGATHFLPKKNRLNYWKSEILDQLAVLMGGRVAEEIFLGDISSGAQMDITQATRLVRSMVCEWGMNDKLGLVTYDERGDTGQYLGLPGYHEKNYSEETAKAIDDEVRAILDQAHSRAREIVEMHRNQMETMAESLMDLETLYREDVDEIMTGTWDVVKARKRHKHAEDLQRKLPPPPPQQVTDRLPKPLADAS